MRSQRLIIAAVAATAIAASAGTAGAQSYGGSIISMSAPQLFSYGGSWPVTITHSQRSNGTGCLTLIGNTSGSATLTFGSQQFQNGSFLVRDGIILAEIAQPLQSQNGALLFIAHTSRGSIGRGIFEDIEGGANFDSGALVFGAKNGC